ncbi:hypothetical protein BaRGS_00039973 [Batillaria attramentaria]|uniref:Uncharacterized protein n=1 Tax=Batillaria attramentaria TaxID=370345 RepID=A0ABD0J1F5_9CAEN
MSNEAIFSLQKTRSNGALEALTEKPLKVSFHGAKREQKPRISLRSFKDFAREKMSYALRNWQTWACPVTKDVRVDLAALVVKNVVRGFLDRKLLYCSETHFCPQCLFFK